MAGAVIEGPNGVLLVRNRRRDGSLDWSPPGGVIAPGEEVRLGLAREILEETGLMVTGWEGPIYKADAVAVDLGWHLRAEVHRAVTYVGFLRPDDPDGIVVDARFIPLAACAVMLEDAHPWVVEPLAAWLAERWGPDAQRGFHYQVNGTDRASLTVTRL